ncbi:hypothetical protein TEA_017162 [Camellia sinensis var. sinensis]|uniref:Cysteine protease n=1 Tax=Camellia sinensis var. sinensis TaxID=542762 RepID=A0A4S4ENF4_CAMSN|nr:hypothetical protein TEA_017162 [Camellia sinensis var. sinensis]
MQSHIKYKTMMLSLSLNLHPLWPSSCAFSMVSWLLFGTFLSFTFGLLMNIPSSGCPYEPVDLWSGFFLSAFSTFETHGEPKGCGKKGFGTRSNGWTAAVKRVMNGGSMRRIQERVLGLYKTGIFSSTSDLWHLGFWYKISQEDSSSDLAISDGPAAFVEDFSSRILLTYRKGFAAIGDSKYTSDVNWGCMLRSSWPDACCSVRFKREESELEDQSFPMAIYVVSSDEDGERGGAPIVCIEDASRHCFEFSKGQANWTPILLLVPLVLGLDKINPRAGASTYIVSMQDEETFYLDPHEVQPVVDIRRDNLEADTSSYHCNVVRHVPLDSVDSSLAIGFYCRDKDDFDDFCNRASKLADESKGAPLFTVTHTRNPARAADHYDMLSDTNRNQRDESFDIVHGNNAEGGTQEDDCDWQLL